MALTLKTSQVIRTRLNLVFPLAFLLANKLQATGIFKVFAKKSRNLYNAKVLKVQNDNGSKFNNTSIKGYCNKKGIKHEFSAIYTLEQNKVVERKNKTLITLARAMLDVHEMFGQKQPTPHATRKI